MYRVGIEAHFCAVCRCYLKPFFMLSSIGNKELHLYGSPARAWFCINSSTWDCYVSGRVTWEVLGSALCMLKALC